jgi:predicted MFS family arabinose efflux permease
LPQIAGIIGTVLMGRHSDKTRERRWNYATCVVVATIGLITTTVSQGNLLASVIVACTSRVTLNPMAKPAAPSAHFTRIDDFRTTSPGASCTISISRHPKPCTSADIRYLA